MARRKKNSRKSGQGRPEGLGAWTSPHGLPANGRIGADPASGRLLERLVRARIENLRLLRAIASEVGDLASVEGLPGEVRELEEYDRMICLGLHVVEIEGEPLPDSFASHHERILEFGDTLRGEVRALLPWKIRSRVHRTGQDAQLSEEDVWRDLREFRQNGRHRALCPPLEGRIPHHQRIPQSADPLPWLERQTRPWIRTVAAQHGIPDTGSRGAMTKAVAAVLRDPEKIGPLLATALDATERGLLARYTAHEVTQRALISEAQEADLVPDWDGRGEVPDRPGARLRALGLVYLGWMDGIAQVVMQPETLRRILARRLLLHHTGDLHDLSAAERCALEETAATSAWGA